MKYEVNQPVYHVPFARLLKDFQSKTLGCMLHKGEEYPVYEDASDFIKSYLAPGQIQLMIRERGIAVHIIPVDGEALELFIKEIVPEFTVGEIVDAKYNGDSMGRSMAFRIYEYTISAGEVWYRNGWSKATGCEAGALESTLKLAPPEAEEYWEVKYNDSLVQAWAVRQMSAEGTDAF